MTHWFVNAFRPLALSAALLLAAFFASGQVARPTDRLYTVLVEANQTGWTADRRREAAALSIELGDLSAAVAHWEAALLLEPEDIELMRRTAELYVQRGRWPDALDAVRRLLAALPDDAWANLHLGLLLAPTSPANAETALRRAAQAGMQPPPGLIDTLETGRRERRSVALAVGAVLADAKLYAYAERAFGIAATLDVARGESLASVALMRGLQGKDGGRWLDEALATTPNSPQVHAAAGLYYRATGYLFESLQAFAAALELAPLDAHFNAELAAAYALIGDGISAAFWYGQAARLAPGDPRYAGLFQAAVATLTPPAP